MSLTPLPVDAELPSLLGALETGSAAVLEAPPGAGKTTRVPPALLDQSWCSGTVLVSEPRRIAARLSATRVAQERGQKLGGTTGYQVRFDDKTGSDTRLIYLTEGLLLRRLLDSPELPGVSAVVLDEVHERSADLDCLLALLAQTQKLRPDLRVIAMSATLDAEQLLNYLPAASHHRSEGRSFEVSVEYAKEGDDRPLAIQVRSAVRGQLERSGDLLVVLPGAREIRDCEEALAAMSELEVVPLHGDLPVEAQAKAVAKNQGKRRVILSTNVAESSLTIPGVTTVIDSGLARTAVFDPWAGVSRLETIMISQARCVQRSGRAGRVGPGHAVRLYSRGAFERRPAQDSPEITRCDLSDVLLRLKAAQLKLSAPWSPQELNWLTPPSTEAWAQAKKLLNSLGALENEGLTELGTEMARLPLPPRLSRCLLESLRLGIEQEGALITALLSERDILRSRRSTHGPADVTFGDSDLDDRCDRFHQLADDRFAPRTARDLQLDLRGAKQVDKIRKANLKALNSARSKITPGRKSKQPITQALLTGYPDRVGSRRGKGRDFILSDGLQASLDELSCVVHAPLILAVSTDAPGGKQRKPLIRIACALDPDLLMELAGDQIEATDELEFNSEKSRVDAVSKLSYGKVTLDESRSTATPDEDSAAVLAQAALEKGPAVYDPQGRLESLLVRLQLLLSPTPTSQLVEGDEERLGELIASPDDLARAALLQGGLTHVRLAEIQQLDLTEQLEYSLSPSIQKSLRLETPKEVTLKGGRRLQVRYEAGRQPWIESRLQDFFSMTETPTICGGRQALQLHLLAPNRRAVQVTTDLGGFWERHYPELRKQLMRRYPKHLWPEDGATASPPQPGKIR